LLRCHAFPRFQPPVASAKIALTPDQTPLSKLGARPAMRRAAAPHAPNAPPETAIFFASPAGAEDFAIALGDPSLGLAANCALAGFALRFAAPIGPHPKPPHNLRPNQRKKTRFGHAFCADWPKLDNAAD
jgi:hypothetical protein